MRPIALSAFQPIAIMFSLMLSNAQAHHLWLEQPDVGKKGGVSAKAYFGEFGDNLREISPGRLDRFVKPVAQKTSAKGSEPLQVTASPTGFALSARAAPGESLVIEEPAYPLSERKEGDKTIRTLYVPAARLVVDHSQQAPRLALDLVPTGTRGKKGMEVQAFYKGQPLPKAKIGVNTAAGWSQEHNADEQGKLMVKLPWKGLYVLEVKHADGAGERGGQAYDRASYVTSLTLTRRAGLAPLSPAPETAPKKIN